MKVASLLALCLFVVYINAAVIPPFPAPAFFWSGDSYFVGRDAQTLQSLSETDVANFVAAMFNSQSNQEGLLKFVSVGARRPEAVIVWVEDQPKAGRASYAFIQPLLAAAGSSFVAPYTYPNLPVSQTILTQVQSGSEFGKAITVSGETVSLDALLALIEENKAIFADGKVDLLLINIKHQDVGLVAPVEEKVRQYTSAFVSLFTADYVVEHNDKLESERMAVRSAGDEYAKGEYWPSSVWSGLVITITLLIILALAIGCMFELQTPTRWEKTKRTIRETN